MGNKKLLAAFFLPLLLASFLQSQSLAELAKKEKERRAALKGRATTVTTADIAKVKKRPAVEATEGQAAEEVAAEAGQAGEAEGQVQEGVTPPATGKQVSGAEGEAAAGAEAVKPAEEPPPAEAPPLPENDYRARQAELAKAVKEKFELVDLLTLKMNALYQEFYNLESLKSRELLQAQISDTYDKLLKAETESDKAQKDLEEFVAKTKKENTPAIWIR